VQFSLTNVVGKLYFEILDWAFDDGPVQQRKRISPGPLTNKVYWAQKSLDPTPVYRGSNEVTEKY